MRWSFFALIVFLNHLSPGLAAEVSAVDPAKYTVCTITKAAGFDAKKKLINEQIKKDTETLNPLVELTDFGAGDDWFKKACASGISCDRLVVFGDFNGNYVASQSNRRDGVCGGILAQPYEILFFGSKKLNTREQDIHIPYGYLRQLFGVQPGYMNFSVTDSNCCREADLGAHLKAREVTRLVRGSDVLNVKLKRGLEKLEPVQCSASGGVVESERDRIVRVLSDPLISLEQKLALLPVIFARKDYVDFFPLLNELLRKYPVSKMTAQQKMQLRALADNALIKRQMLVLVSGTKDMSNVVDMLSMTRALGFIDADKERGILSARVSALFDTALSAKSMAMLCSLRDTEAFARLELDWSRLEKTTFTANEIDALECLPKKGMPISLQTKFLAAGLKNPDAGVRWKAVHAFKDIKPQEKELQLQLLEGLDDEDAFVRWKVIDVFVDINPKDQEVTQKLVKDLSYVDAVMQSRVIDVLYGAKPKDRETQMKLAELLKSNDIGLKAANVLSIVMPKDKDVQLKMVEVLNDPNVSAQTKEVIKTIFMDLPSLDAEVLDALKHADRKLWRQVN